MSKISICLILLFSSFVSMAQFTEKFGKLTSEEINTKSCSFDPEATALILLQEGSADYGQNYELVMYRHMRIRILKDEAINDLANIKIRFYSGSQFEYVDDIDAITVNIDDDGKRIDFPVDKKTIFYKKLNEYWSEVSFALPQVKVGSILEYRYRRVKKSFQGLKDWSFQSAYPVVKSSFSLKPSPNIELSYSIQKSENYPITIQRSKSAEGYVYFEMNNIPGMDEEPYMDTKEDYLQKINFQLTKYMGIGGVQKYMNNWNEVARELHADSDYGGQLRGIRIPDVQKLLLNEIANLPSLQKMVVIYNYIRRNYQWNGFDSRHAGDGMKALYNSKTGTSGAINYALINLLRAAELDAYPLMVSERDNGKINTSQPFVAQFNTTYAYVKINDKEYYLDATNKFSSPYLIPIKILNTTALLLRKQTGELIKINENKHGFDDFIYLSSQINEDGEFAGKVQSTRKDYSRIESMYQHADDSVKYIKWLKRDWSNIELDSLVITNLDNDTLPLKESFTFKTNAQQTGDYVIVPVNILTDFGKNPFISSKRFSDVNFGTKQRVIFNHFIKYPPNMEIDALPKKTMLITPDKTISFTREVKENPAISFIQIMIKVEVLKSEFPVDEYPNLQEFYKKMIEMLNEPIVFKRK